MVDLSILKCVLRIVDFRYFRICSNLALIKDEVEFDKTLDHHPTVLLQVLKLSSSQWQDKRFHSSTTSNNNLILAVTCKSASILSVIRW